MYARHPRIKAIPTFDIRHGSAIRSLLDPSGEFIKKQERIQSQGYFITSFMVPFLTLKTFPGIDENSQNPNIMLRYGLMWFEPIFNEVQERHCFKLRIIHHSGNNEHLAFAVQDNLSI